MLANNPYERYKQTRVETAGPLQLIIMLYDGAIRFTRQAAHAIEERDYEKANEYLKRAQDIIDELNFSLNLEAGDIAKNLQQLYEFINHQLVQANVKKDAASLQSVERILVTLRSAWDELRKPENKKAVGV
ncbi:MAG TPA: flagellar export chaperone FliS [Firmicutes bacterium]|jgi:flagellar protein FliS|nr:flagellar export chaperone FliS [Bacillota bacterium]HOQ23867.1 flagellar export chaperone FliS [Bacillota bacterium]HPT66502.1 flagellar export chaperone FliS [Bacillota bacterium]